ncbi:hypothetical protein K503DRAFT_250184 [Rhizopogon vinicolor AM-OR11-026]|uniref:Uncharacterized protein n=1 Tax=Rhizopogon vinicolor AM-OR11-026 TaxID=1314800 RepID=A0A1B7MX43_9AGAM|nr:hypothetical protein K503DRAFT_250184 [Rhizopogon vinicolor AM-OR11-026]
MTRGQARNVAAARVRTKKKEEEQKARKAMAQMSAALPSPVCTTSKCAKCLQGGQSRNRKRCTTQGCQCSCPRFVGLPTQRQQTGEQCQLIGSHTNNSTVSMSSSEGDFTMSTATSDTSSVDYGSDKGQAGSLGAVQLVSALQHSLHLLLEWTKLDNWGQFGKGKHYES